MACQNVIMQSGNRFKLLFKFILLMVSLLVLSSTSLAREITPQEINTKQCKGYIDSIYDGLRDIQASKYFTRENAALKCTNEMNNNYKNGLPSYATHTPHDVAKYREAQQNKFTLELRARNKDTLDRIRKSCAEPVFKIYLGMYAKKSRGESKEQQVKSLRAIVQESEIKTLLDGITMNMSYDMLDEIYAKTGPATDAEVGKNIVAFHKKCTALYEESLFLR